VRRELLNEFMAKHPAGAENKNAHEWYRWLSD